MKFKEIEGCNRCANTGILKSSIVRSEENDKRIAVIICGGHDTSAAEKNIAAMHRTTGLDVDVIGVEGPVE